MGGFIASGRQWRDFEDQWVIALNEAGIPMFHATGFYTRQAKPFNAWSNEKHVQFSKRFTAIVARHMVAGVSRGVDVSAYATFVAPERDLVLPNTWRALNIQPQRLLPIMFCTRVCLEWTARNLPDKLKREPIAVVFDDGTYGLGATIEYCQFLQRNTLWARSLCSFTTALKSASPPLQAADLMAWLSHKQLAKEIQSSGQPTHRALQRLVQTKRISISVGTQRSLPVFVAELKRWRQSLGDTP